MSRCFYPQVPGGLRAPGPHVTPPRCPRRQPKVCFQISDSPTEGLWRRGQGWSRGRRRRLPVAVWPLPASRPLRPAAVVRPELEAARPQRPVGSRGLVTREKVRGREAEPAWGGRFGRGGRPTGRGRALPRAPALCHGPLLASVSLCVHYSTSL